MVIIVHNIPLKPNDKSGDLQNSILSVTSIGQALAAAGTETKVILPVTAMPDEKNMDLWFNNSISNNSFSIAPVVINPRRNKMQKYFLPSVLFRLLKKDNPACIITRSAPWGLSLSKHGFNTIIDLHTHKLAKHSFLNQYFSKKLIQSSYQNQNLRIIAISQTLATYWLINKINRQSISFAHNGFDSDSYMEPSSSDKVRKELGLSKEEKIVLYAGSFWSQRGIEIIFKAAQLLPNFYFVLIGGPFKQKQALEDQCQKANIKNIRFLKPVRQRELSSVLFSANVLLGVFSSQLPTAEYFSSLKIMEYMATGIPVVTQDFSGIRELIQDNITGYIAKPDDTQSLVSKIKQAANSHNSKVIGNNARQYAFNNLTWAHRAEKFKGVVHSISKL